MTRFRPARHIVPPLGIAALAAIGVAHYALRIHTLQNDEVLSLWGSRWLDVNFPQGLWNWGTITDRGLERLTPIALSAFRLIGRSPQGELEAMRWAAPTMYALAALPAYALARGLGARRLLATLTAVLAVAGPWAVFGTSWLNTGAAYGTTVLAVWAMWRCVVMPSMRNDLLAILAVLLAGAARVGNVSLGIALPIAVLAHSLRERGPGEPIDWRGLPRRVLRDHFILVVLAGVVLIYVLTGGIHKIGGAYAVNFGQPQHVFGQRLRIVSAQLALGTGIAPLLIGGAWVLKQIVRPSDARAGAFAVLALVSALILTYVSSLAGPEERYVAPIVPLVMIAFVMGLSRRAVGWILPAVLAVLVVRSITFLGPPQDLGGYTFFVAPAAQWYHRVIVGKASLAWPFGDRHMAQTVAIGASMLALALVLAVRRLPRWAPVMTACAAIVVGAYGGAAAAYDMRKFSEQAGYPALPWKAQAWLDDKVHGAPVIIEDYGPTGQTYRPLFEEVRNFNRSVAGTLVYGGLTTGCCGWLPQIFDLSVDARTGRAGTFGHGVLGNIPLPRYLLSTVRYLPIGLPTRVIAQSAYQPQPVQLLERTGPLRLTYAVQGVQYDGYLLAVTKEAPPSIRVFRAPRSVRTCLHVVLRGPDGAFGRREVWLEGLAIHLRDAFAADVKLPLPGLARRPWVDVPIRVRGVPVKLADGRRVTALLMFIERTAC